MRGGRVKLAVLLPHRTNVGCVWIKSNVRTFTLMSQVSDHLERKAGWDQQVGALRVVCVCAR